MRSYPGSNLARRFVRAHRGVYDDTLGDYGPQEAFHWVLLISSQWHGITLVLGLEKEKAKQLKERRSASKLLTKTSFLVNITLLTIAWAILLMLIRARIRVY